ncbi:hypothetical protein TCDM_09396 [Trypanosoma cruzi Dm28c]|uniref:Uncharacterized protein n=1 Tax=Trypanosoma cruzi Dm28c TaxID=1416333 RepID=V5BA22_TRYCR|nr:hypothetical protein TCDM_09396 [Trypanosoma cruzi Dm28c]
MPAAHGQSSSSPSLLSLACSLQHKLTTRQRRVKAKRREKSHSRAQLQVAATAEAENTPQKTDRTSTIAKLA